MPFLRTYGTRAEVWHGTAKKTSGGLSKTMLLKNKNGRIVSRKKHNSAKREKRLVKAGYLTKKGKFGFIKSGKSKKGSRKMRGGNQMAMPMGHKMMKGGNQMAMPMGHKMMKGGSGISQRLSPFDIAGEGYTSSSNSLGVQDRAGEGN